MQQSKLGEADAAIALLKGTREKIIVEYQRIVYDALSKASRRLPALRRT